MSALVELAIRLGFELEFDQTGDQLISLRCDEDQLSEFARRVRDSAGYPLEVVRLPPERAADIDP